MKILEICEHGMVVMDRSVILPRRVKDGWTDFMAFAGLGHGSWMGMVK